jgi:hypothetical protein
MQNIYSSSSIDNNSSRNILLLHRLLVDSLTVVSFIGGLFDMCSSLHNKYLEAIFALASRFLEVLFLVFSVIVTGNPVFLVS